MADVIGQQVIDAIAAQTTVIGSLKVYNDGLRKALVDAAANHPLTVAEIQQIFLDVNANNQGIADAMVDNVPVPVP